MKEEFPCELDRLIGEGDLLGIYIRESSERSLLEREEVTFLFEKIILGRAILGNKPSLEAVELVGKKSEKLKITKDYLLEILEKHDLSEMREFVFEDKLMGVPEDLRREQVMIAKVARETVLTHNLGLVTSRLKKYEDSKIPFLDLVEEGNFGLMRAVEDFDPRKGKSFSTYAVWWIKKYMNDFVRSYGDLSRKYWDWSEKYELIYKAKEELKSEGHNNPSTDDICKKLGGKITKANIETILLERQPVESLSVKKKVDNGDKEAEEMVQDCIPGWEPWPEDEVVRRENGREIEGYLKILPERQVRMACWLAAGDERGKVLSVNEIGDKMGVSRQAAAQLKNRMEKVLTGKKVLRDIYSEVC